MMHDTIWVTQKPLMRNQVKPNSFCFVFVIQARRRNSSVFIGITDSGCLSTRLFTCLPGWTSVRESVLTTLVSRRSLEVPLLPMMMRVKECSSYAQLGILVNSCVCRTSCQHQPHRRHHKQRQHHAQRQHRTVINIGHILNIVNRTERQCELRNLTRTNPDLLLGKRCRTTLIITPISGLSCPRLVYPHTSIRHEEKCLSFTSVKQQRIHKAGNSPQVILSD